MLWVVIKIVVLVENGIFSWFWYKKMINCSTIPICIKSKHDMTICEHCKRGHMEHFGSNHYFTLLLWGIGNARVRVFGGIGGLNVGKVILPLSKDLNPNCSSGASLWSWSADQTVVILITCGNVYNHVNFIRVFLQKRALPSMKLTWISLLKK